MNSLLNVPETELQPKKPWLMVGLSVGVFLILTLFIGGWYITGPARCAATIKSSIQAGDKSGLESTIEFESVRKSVKAQILASTMESKNPFGILAAGLANNMIDTMLTPEGLIAMTKSQQRDGKENRFDVAKLEGGEFVSATEYHVIRNGTTFVFSFKGTGWKVTDIRMPENALKPQ